MLINRQQQCGETNRRDHRNAIQNVKWFLWFLKSFCNAFIVAAWEWYTPHMLKNMPINIGTVQHKNQRQNFDSLHYDKKKTKKNHPTTNNSDSAKHKKSRKEKLQRKKWDIAQKGCEMAESKKQGAETNRLKPSSSLWARFSGGQNKCDGKETKCM